MNSFTIMIDTGCDLPQNYYDEHNIQTVPIPFNLDGVQHDGGRWQEITHEVFYKALHDGSIAGTALINPETFIEVFTEYAQRGESLLLITLSSGLSGTYSNSVIALEDVKTKYPDCNIRMVDSLNATGGIGLLTILAVNKRGEGLSLDETADWLQEKAHSCFALFTVDDLMFLHRGGRLSKVSAIAGKIIGIKPVLNVAPDGTLKLKDKARGRKASLNMIANQLVRSIKPGAALETVVICHGNCIDDAEILAEIVKSKVNVGNIVILMMCPVIGAHAGPGTVALFFEADMTRVEYEKEFYPEK